MTVLSLVHGETSGPLLDLTIPQLLARAVAAHSGRDAAVFCQHDTRLTYTELARAVDALAMGLLALGLKPGDRIGIWSPNRPEWLVTQFATARIGLILVNINPAYRLAELEYALNKVSCAALVTAAAFKSSDYVAMLQALGGKLPHLKTIIRMGAEKTAGMLNFADVPAAPDPARLDAISAALSPDDAINIQFTSGTTGQPKGATLTHRNIVNNASMVTARMNFTAEDRLCIPVPLYHCFGMVMGTLGCVSKGAAMVFPGEAFEPGAALAAVAAENCTAIYGVPTMFVAMLDHPEFVSFDVSSLRTGCMAGSPCPIAVMNRVVADMHMSEVTIAYGMTETSPVSFQSTTTDPVEKRVTTVGRIHPHLSVKLVDAQGAIVRRGATGELCTRGYSVMKGYWDDPARTGEAIDADGFMHTGDLATLDDEGYCNIVGRVKDMVIRGGENIYPREVEEFLYRHPDIREVQVFGIPDAKFGEELCAWIVLHQGRATSAEDVRSFCDGQIAHYKIPRHVQFKDSLPMTITGKPQKFLMREAMAAELGRVLAKTA